MKRKDVDYVLNFLHWIERNTITPDSSCHESYCEGLYRSQKVLTKAVNEGVSPKKYGIFQNVSNWLYAIIGSATVGVIVGAVIGFILAGC